MPDQKKNGHNTSTNKRNLLKVSSEVGNYEKHPFFVKKLNKAKELIEKVGLPKVLVKKSN